MRTKTEIKERLRKTKAFYQDRRKVLRLAAALHQKSRLNQKSKG